MKKKIKKSGPLVPDRPPRTKNLELIQNRWKYIFEGKLGRKNTRKFLDLIMLDRPPQIKKI